MLVVSPESRISETEISGENKGILLLISLLQHTPIIDLLLGGPFIIGFFIENYHFCRLIFIFRIVSIRIMYSDYFLVYCIYL